MRDEIKQWVKAWGIVPSSAGGWLAVGVYTPWGVLDMSAAWTGRSEHVEDFAFPPSGAVPGLGFVSWAEKSEQAYESEMADVLAEEIKAARLERAARKRELVLNAQLRDAGIEGQAVWLKPGEDAPEPGPLTPEGQAWVGQAVHDMQTWVERQEAELWDRVRKLQELEVSLPGQEPLRVDALGGPDCGLCAAGKLCPFCERQS